MARARNLDAGFNRGTSFCLLKVGTTPAASKAYITLVDDAAWQKNTTLIFKWVGLKKAVRRGLVHQNKLKRFCLQIHNEAINVTALIGGRKEKWVSER